MQIGLIALFDNNGHGMAWGGHGMAWNGMEWHQTTEIFYKQGLSAGTDPVIGDTCQQSHATRGLYWWRAVESYSTGYIAYIAAVWCCVAY